MTSSTKRESKVLSSQLEFNTTLSIVNYADNQFSSLERIVRDANASREYGKIARIVDQLCQDYAYAVHQPHARNGGLIGLAAASIALGSVRRTVDPT